MVNDMIQAVKGAEIRALDMERAALKNKEKILSDTKQEIDELRKQTELMLKKEREEALSQAKDQCQSILMKALSEAEQEKIQLKLVADSKKESVFQLVLRELNAEA